MKRTDPWPRKKSPRGEWQLNVAYFRSFAVSLLGVLPVALIAGTGAWHTLGVVYFITWLMATTPIMATLVMVWYDAVLILAGRQPVFFVRMFVEYELHEHEGERRAVTWLHRTMTVSAWLNPLGNLTVALMILAMQMRPRLSAELFREVELQVEERRKQRRPGARDSLTHFAAPVLDRIDREEQRLMAAIATC